MARATGKPLRLFGALDPAWSAALLDTTETDATEADPRPGRATTTEPYPRLDPSCVGAQAVDLELVVLQSGFPTLGRQDLGVGFYVAGEALSDVRGYIPPAVVSDWQGFGSGASDRVDAASCGITGHAVVVCGAASDSYALVDPVTGLLSTLPDPSATLGDYAGLVYLYGSTRLYSIGRDGTYVSDDHGATWAPVETGGAVASAVSAGTWAAETGRIKYRAVTDARGGLGWFGLDSTGGSYKVRGAASSDGGATWRETSELPDSTPSANLVFDACSAPDGTVYVIVDDAAGVLLYRLTSVFDRLEDATPETVATPASRSTSIAIGCDSNGMIWAWWQSTGTPAEARYSRDRGLTWTRSADLYRYDESYLRVAAHPFGGFATGWQGASNGSGYLRLGGWSGPRTEGNDWASTASSRLDAQWFAFTAPSAAAVVNATAVGAGTYTTTGGRGLYQSGAGANAIHHQVDVHSGDRIEAATEFALRVDDDGGTTGAAPNASGIGLELRARSAGANQRRTVTLWADEAGYRVRDMEAGAWLHTKVAVDMVSGRVFFRLSFNGSTGEVQHRVEGATKWTRTTFTGITTAATAASAVRVDWGNLTGTANATSSWWWVKARGADAPGLVGLDNVGLGASRYPVPDAYDAARGRVCYLQVAGGPAVIGDAYSLPADHGYPVEAVFPRTSPSPDVPWRSLDRTTAAVIAVDAAADSNAGDTAGGIAFAVRGANVRTVQLRGRPDGGAWATVATLDLAEGFSGLTGNRAGRVLYPAGGAEGARYVRRGELAGGWAILADGDLESECRRRIRDNSAGWWGGTLGAAGGPQIRVHLEEVDGSEPTTGFATALVWPAGVVVVEQPTTVYRHWALRIPANTQAAEDWFEVGASYLFGTLAPGKQWSGAEWGHAPNVGVAQDTRGTDRRAKLGEIRRSLSLTWDDGMIEARHVGATRATSAYLSTSAGYSRVAQDDVRGQILGLLRSSDGGASPILVLLGDHTTTSGDTITDPTRWLVGYLDGEIRWQPATHLDPDTGEFGRVGSVLVVEAV